MKKRLLYVSMATLIATAATVTHADESGAYIEASYTNYGDSDTIGGQNVDLNLGVGALSLGYRLNPNLSFEGFIGSGMTDDSITVGGNTFDVSINSAYGFHIKPSFDISEQVTLFARLGYIWYEGEVSLSGVSATTDVDEASYGVGAEFNFTDSVYGQVSYMTIDGSGGFGLGIGTRF